jgi:hypothetical protein
VAIHLRQICLGARRLAPTIEELTAVLSLKPCYIDSAVAAYVLENTLLPVGAKFLEVVAPVQECTAAGRTEVVSDIAAAELQ